jgi:nucleotide-binding universal stress UspA family protein
MKVLVPVDGSQHAMEGLRIAVDYARAKGADICLLTVVPTIVDVDLEISAGERERVIERLEKQGEVILKQAIDVLYAGNLDAHCRKLMSSVSVADAIIDYAEKEDADLIIIGSRGLSPSSRLRMGSVALAVVTNSPCSVYVVKMKSE